MTTLDVLEDAAPRCKILLSLMNDRLIGPSFCWNIQTISSLLFFPVNDGLFLDLPTEHI